MLMTSNQVVWRNCKDTHLHGRRLVSIRNPSVLGGNGGQKRDSEKLLVERTKGTPIRIMIGRILYSIQGGALNK